MNPVDLPMTADGLDIDFGFDGVVSGEREWKQAVLLRLQNDVSFTNLDFGINLDDELGQVGRSGSLALRASAAIQNDERFTATVVAAPSIIAGRVERIILDIDVIVDDTGQTFSLAVLVADGKVTLAV
jgi:hypothetical protein